MPVVSDILINDTFNDLFSFCWWMKLMLILFECKGNGLHGSRSTVDFQCYRHLILQSGGNFRESDFNVEFDIQMHLGFINYQF